jgi:hypothetical protein
VELIGAAIAAVAAVVCSDAVCEESNGRLTHSSRRSAGVGSFDSSSGIAEAGRVASVWPAAIDDGAVSLLQAETTAIKATNESEVKVLMCIMCPIWNELACSGAMILLFE